MSLTPPVLRRARSPRRTGTAFVFALLAVGLGCGGTSLRRLPDAGTSPAREDAAESGAGGAGGAGAVDPPDVAAADATDANAGAGGTGGSSTDAARDGVGGAGGSDAGGARDVPPAETGAADRPADAPAVETGAPDAPAEAGPPDAATVPDASAPDVVAEAAAEVAVDVAADPVVTSCGGVTCPALFTVLAACRPSGSCRSEIAIDGINACHDNGVRVSTRPDVASMTARLAVTRPDGVTPCYGVEVGSPIAGARPLTVRRPDGVQIAQGFIEPGAAGRITIVCDGTSSVLQDRSCIALPGAENCLPGTCR